MPKPSSANSPARRRRRTRPLGPFMYLLMCTLSRLPSFERYGSILEQELSDKYAETIDIAGVYVTLGRLVDRGLIEKSEVSQSVMGTKHLVTLYSMTPAGREALAHAARFYKMLAAEAPKS